MAAKKPAPEPDKPETSDDDSPRARFDRGEIRWRELIELEQQAADDK